MISPGRQLGLLWGGVAAALLLLSPLAPVLAARLPACPFLRLTGLPCPGCGTTRAALALARWAPIEALGHNPLSALGWSVLVGGGLLAGAAALAGRELGGLPRTLPARGRWAALAVVALNWIYLLRSAG